ncbi:MAG TPA: protein kinase [Planctomycetota bacterium]|jgi:WD40 repeat protein/predicted Ser/Thr protein kinase|nr:protein kinase [Planctomycetota bacterium]
MSTLQGASEEESRRFRRVVACFEAAALLSPADRAAFLDRSCADDASVRREVEAMLAANEREDAGLAPGQGLEMLVRARPAARRAEVDSAAESPPELLGQYRILRVLGEGGMGIVYEAEQAIPRRTVALKAIRPGLASQAVLRRFEHEAHVLARMHHPGIAQIYEAGTAMPERGLQAFIAMEFVDGKPLVEHARSAGASDRERVQLLVRVCDAVQHAHQRGVIHRDLKPSNILVDKNGQPRVLDFGVARLSDPDGFGDGRTTAPGLLVGTLAYMSPEQVSGDPSEVDARTDVYALGVLLYELLTDALPHPVEGRSLPEVAVAIRNDPAPSLASVDRRLRGDLTAIAAKALETERERRYASAADLAADLRRHLSGEPVAALRAARFYVLRRQISRHRWLVAAGAAFVLGLAAFAIVAEVQRRRADENARAFADALSKSNVARARLLAATGDFTAAEELLWDEHFASPTSRSHWSLWDLYSRHPCLETFEGPIGAILSIDATRDGRWIATGTHERQVVLWDAAARRGATLPGEHAGIVMGLAFDPGGARLYSLDSEGLLVAWDVAARTRAWELRLEGGGGGALARDASGTTLAAACVDGRVRLVDPATRRVTAVLAGHVGKVRCVAAGPRGSYVSAGDDGAIRVWGSDPNVPLAEIEAHAEPVVAMDVDPNGSLVASGAADGRIRVFELASRKKTAELALADIPVRSLRFSPDGASLLATGARRMRIFDLRASPGAAISGGPPSTLEESVQVAIFDPSGTSILAGGASSPLRRWEAASGGHQTRVELPMGKPGLSGFARDGHSVATTENDGRVRVSRLPEGVTTAEFEFGSGAFQVLAFDPTTTHLLVIERSGPVHVCDLEKKREVFARDLGANALNGARFSPDGTRIACAGRDGSIEVLDAATGATVARLSAGLGETQRLAFGPDSKTIASTHPDGKIGLWRLDGARAIGRLEVPWQVFSIAFVHGTGRLAVGGWNGMLQVWDLTTRAPVATFTGHAQVVTSISSSTDGSLIASASFDGTVRVWDAETGEARLAFEPGAGIAQNVSFAPDGSRITSAHDDGSFRIWDLRYFDRHIAGNLGYQSARHAAQGAR